MDWMIYGANGYTGDLIAREAKKRGADPILAGRDATKIAELARRPEPAVESVFSRCAARYCGGASRHRSRLELCGTFFEDREPADAGLPDRQGSLSRYYR